ncbi:ABC transporter substrate-binding protein [Paenibacillus albicereus]|uniref:ABC transporter substrate-binding protein n=1 Tax=Paenibacillus albicereus TaxID=2726185 RepID=A0A6H2GSC5_9BACL|nr:ABC transporter substrate-binding protein [Paenibacillus albicereus]QJC50302.1 ABC transporter substrate-binding protein [Paenibacillus albicereus]
MKRIGKGALALVLSASLALVSACSNASRPANEPSGEAPAAGGAKSVTVGVTYAPSNINPLAPVGLVSTYVASLLFPPLVDLDSDLQYKPMLADSIETSDNKTFTIKLNEKAAWTDGKPVTADDVIFTLGLMSNPKVASNLAYQFAIIEGLDDAGYLPEGQSAISGVKKVDERTLTVTTKAPTTLSIFQDTIGKNLLTLPQSALAGIAPEELAKSDFMQRPDVTSGPFKLAEYNRDQFVRLEANDAYFKGAPKLDALNFKVLQGNAVTAQLQSGEIDMNIPSAGVIPVGDYEKVKGLQGIRTVEAAPLATQFMYINEKAVPDAKQRQAISYAMNRQQIVDKLLHGAGEVVDSYFTSYSPYRDESVQPAVYDPDKAKSLLAESGWDSGKTLRLYVLSGDATLEQAASIVAENLRAAGVQTKIQMMDLATLIDNLVKMDYDLGILTVSLTPINPLPDIAYFLKEGNPSGYKNAEAEKLLDAIAAETDEAKIKQSYSDLQKIIAQDVPMPAIYATKALGAVNERVTGAEPKDFGMFINVYEWDVK